MTVSDSDADRVRLLRRTLTATGAGIYLATHVAGPLPAETMAAAHESDELELRLGRVGPDRVDDLELREREARAAAAAAIYAEFDRVVLAHGAADAARSVALEVLASRAGVPSRVLLIEGLAEPVARAVRQAARAACAPVDVSAEAPRILPGDLALVVMAHIDDVGRLADPRPLAATAKRAGARLLVDASLSVGALPERVSELAADAVVADVHRWLLGPEGMALTWLSPDLGDEMPDRLRAACGLVRPCPAPVGRSERRLAVDVRRRALGDGPDRAACAKHLRAGLAAIDAGVRGRVEPGRCAMRPLLAFRIRGWEARGRCR